VVREVVARLGHRDVVHQDSDGNLSTRSGTLLASAIESPETEGEHDGSQV
jgi:hypothetical protein